MLRNYLAVAVRNLHRHRAFSLINIVGLAVGLATCLLILLFVRDELSYDRFHTNADRIYRVETNLPAGTGVARFPHTLFTVASSLPDVVPGIEATVRVRREDQPLVARTGTETRFYEDHVLHTEPSFFALFDFELARGSADDLARPNTAIVSESTAARYFPGEDPVGQHITAYDKWSSDSREYEVVGVMTDMPHNVHFRADFLLSMVTKLDDFGDRLDRVTAYTYVLLEAGRSAADISTLLPDFARNHLPDRYQRVDRPLALMPLTRIHLHDVANIDIEPQGDIRYVYLFSAIALLVLLIACINYMNLATARAARRAKEVGVRKVVGAMRRQLVYQFLGESLLFTGLALLLALALARLALPAFNAMMNRDLSLSLVDGPLLVGLVVASLLVGLAAGSYSAFVLSAFRPTSVLKGSTRTRAGTTLRKGLVVFQFSVSAGLIVCTVIILQQLHFVQNTRLGFDKEQVLIVRARTALTDQAETFRQALLQLSGVVAVGRGDGIPGEVTSDLFLLADNVEQYEGDPMIFGAFWVDPHFIPTLGIEMATGRSFSEAFPRDADEAILINETAAMELGWDEPLGKTIQFESGPKQIVGVVQDFHLTDMRFEVNPVVLQLSEEASRFYTVRFDTADIPGLIAGLEQTWQRFVAEQPFDYSFMDDDFAAMYRAEQRLAQLLSVFAMLTILIACLGLFGLAAFTAEQRTKEIGVRKVLGATVAGLVVLLSKDFLKLVGLALVIATPIAYLVMNRWLADFAYRVEIGEGTFVLTAMLALLIALFTVSYQAIKAARADPVKSLRYE